MPYEGAYWFFPLPRASLASSRAHSGPSKSGKPCDRLTAPVRIASWVMVEKMDSLKESATGLTGFMAASLGQRHHHVEFSHRVTRGLGVGSAAVAVRDG